MVSKSIHLGLGYYCNQYHALQQSANACTFAQDCKWPRTNCTEYRESHRNKSHVATSRFTMKWKSDVVTRTGPALEASTVAAISDLSKKRYILPGLEGAIQVSSEMIEDQLIKRKEYHRSKRNHKRSLRAPCWWPPCQCRLDKQCDWGNGRCSDR